MRNFPYYQPLEVSSLNLAEKISLALNSMIFDRIKSFGNEICRSRAT